MKKILSLLPLLACFASYGAGVVIVPWITNASPLIARTNLGFHDSVYSTGTTAQAEARISAIAATNASSGVTAALTNQWKVDATNAAYSWRSTWQSDAAIAAAAAALATSNGILVYYGTNVGGSTGGVNVAAGSGLTAVTNPAGLVTLSLYTAPSITSFGNDQSPPLEVGETVTATVLTWGLSGATITSQSIAYSGGGSGTLTPATSQRATNHTSTYTVDRTYTLTCSDGVTPTTATTSVYFQRKRFWGKSSNTSLTSAQMRSLLTGECSTTYAKSFSITPVGEYIYYCYPTNWGVCAINTGLGDVNDWGPTIQSYTNSYSSVTNYYIYRSPSVYNDITYTITAH